MAKDLKKTEQKVLDVYTRVNPSERPIEHDQELFQDMRRMREDLFFYKLHLPKKVFQDATLVSFGCGTGEYELFYALWGCREITTIDMNPISIKRLEGLFRNFEMDHALKKTYAQSYFDVDLGEEKFDFVVADGTVVHTEDPIGALDKFLGHLEEDGFTVISFAELSGMLQRNIQRLILYHLAGENEELLVDYSEQLFEEHITRSVKFGKRTRAQIIYDTYINPKIKTPTIQDVLGIFKKHSISFYSSYPSIAVPFFTSSFRVERSRLEDPSFHHMILLNQLAWMMAAEEDIEVSQDIFSQWRIGFPHFSRFLGHLYDISSNDDHIERFEAALVELAYLAEEDMSLPVQFFVNTRCKEFYQDLESLMTALKNKDLAELKKLTFHRLFKGTCGVGNMYIIGRKGQS